MQNLPEDGEVVYEPTFESVPSTSHDKANHKLRSSIDIGDSNDSALSNDREITSSSSMDESIDSARSISPDAHILTNPSIRNGDSNLETPESSKLDDGNLGSVELPEGRFKVQSGISRPTSPNSNMAELPNQDGTPNLGNPRESSVGSDAYEPPEPKATIDRFETISSPPFSPASPRSVEAASAPLPSFPNTQNDEALTGEVQTLNVDTVSTGQTVGVS
jgi:hypothetical protein